MLFQKTYDFSKNICFSKKHMIFKKHVFTCSKRATKLFGRASGPNCLKAKVLVPKESS